MLFFFFAYDHNIYNIVVLFSPNPPHTHMRFHIRHNIKTTMALPSTVHNSTEIATQTRSIETTIKYNTFDDIPGTGIDLKFTY